MTRTHVPAFYGNQPSETINADSTKQPLPILAVLVHVNSTANMTWHIPSHNVPFPRKRTHYGVYQHRWAFNQKSRLICVTITIADGCDAREVRTCTHNVKPQVKAYKLGRHWDFAARSFSKLLTPFASPSLFLTRSCISISLILLRWPAFRRFCLPSILSANISHLHSILL